MSMVKSSSKKRAQKDRQCLVTSMQVFGKFILRASDADKTLLEEQILSTECFNYWLSTRKSEIKFPKDSFRRTVLAHLRGSDGRAPFDADVESSVLTKLRKRKLVDRLADPFSFCCPGVFERKSYSPSWKLTENYGFHEKLSKENATKPPSPALIKTKLEPVPSQSFLANILGLNDEDLDLKLQIASKHDVKIFPPAIAYLLANHSRTDLRLSRSFIIPEPSARYFKPDWPIFKQVQNYKTWEKQWVDDYCKSIYGDTTGNHLTTVYDSTLEFLNTMRIIQPELQKSGKVWYRFVMTYKENQYAVLVYSERISDCTDMCYLQVDPTIDTANLILPPMLI